MEAVADGEKLGPAVDYQEGSSHTACNSAMWDERLVAVEVSLLSVPTFPHLFQWFQEAKQERKSHWTQGSLQDPVITKTQFSCHCPWRT